MSPDLAISYKRVGIASAGPPPSAPTITDQPDDETIPSGATATLTVTATGTAPLAYQWYEGASGDTSTPVGSSSSSYTTGTLTEDAQYWVRVSNAVGVADSTTADITVTATPEDVLGIPTYLGCFRVQNNAIGVKTLSQLNYGCVTGRKISGNVHLIYTGMEATYGGPIIQIQVPLTLGFNYATAPEAVCSGFWNADGHKDFRGTWRGPTQASPPVEPFFVNANIANIGLFWHESNQRLYLAYTDIYNVGGYNDWGLISIELGTLSGSPPVGNTIGRGPWRAKATDADGNNFYGPWRAAYFCAHPITGKMIVGATLGSGNASSSWGPAIYGDLDWPADDTPVALDAPDLVLTKRYLNYYFMGNKITSDGALIAPHILRSFRRRVDPPIHEGGAHAGTPPTQVNGQVYTDVSGITGSWNERDYAGGHCWIQGANKHGIILTGVAVGDPSQNPADPNAGHEFYGNNLNEWICAHGHDFRALHPEAGPPDTGPCAFATFPWMACYDPADLAAVMNTSNDYLPEPVWFINLNTQFPGFRTAPISTRKWSNLTMGYFDTDTNRLYCMAPGADGSTFEATEAAIFHVFQFSGV